MTNDEKELLDKFRALNEKGRAKALGYIGALYDREDTRDKRSLFTVIPGKRRTI